MFARLVMLGQRRQPLRPTTWIVPALWSAVLVLALIAIAATVAQTLKLTQFLATGSYASPDPADARFARYPILTLLHIVPGFVFMVLGPLQFVKRIRARHLRLHQWSGRVFVASAAVIGVTALAMGLRMALGGANETAATTFFALVFLFALAKAFLHIRRREIAQHREWMIRMFSIGLAIATIRPILALFFAFSALSPQAFFGIAFWLGFTAHLVAAEVWIQHTRPSPRVQRRAPT